MDDNLRTRILRNHSKLNENEKNSLFNERQKKTLNLFS